MKVEIQEQLMGNCQAFSANTDYQLICTERILYNNKKTLHGAICLVEQAAHSNLPFGIIVNRCLAHPRAKSVPVILVNMNSKNTWIRQHLLGTDFFEDECHSWLYDVNLDS